MKNNNIKTKFIFLAIILFGFFGLAKSSEAAEYYVSPMGSANCGSGCLTGAPCSLATVLTCSVVGGDSVILKDGTYTTSLTVPWSGTSGHYITIKAENDGQAIVSGGSNALRTTGKNYITIEGIIFQSSTSDVVSIHSSGNIILRRLTARNTSDTNGSLFAIWQNSSNILLEDCIATGTARKAYMALTSSYVTFRRCYARLTPIGTSPTLMSIYGSPNVIVENCILTKVNSSTKGIAISSQYAATHNAKILGTVVYGLSSDFPLLITGDISTNATGISIQDYISIDNQQGGVLHQFGEDVQMLNSTFVNSSMNSSYGYYLTENSATAGFDITISSTLKNSHFSNYTTGLEKTNPHGHVGTFSHTYNNLYGITTDYSGTTAETGEIDVNPVYNTATYGKGAYLMVPSVLKGKGEDGADIGAEILYKYVNGVETSEPLWPWPMEDRIKNETGYSVTYESGGGLWKTLDGVYSQSDTTPPAAPSGLSVQ